MPQTHGSRILTIEELPEDLGKTIEDFARSLRAENFSKKTRETYTESARALGTYLVTSNSPTAADAITEAAIDGFIISLQEQGKSASTLSCRYRGVQAFLKWCKTKGRITTNPMENMRPPKVPEIAVPVLPSDVIRKLLRACEGRTFLKRRDKAMILLFIDTGMRRQESATLNVTDIDLDNQVAHVLGKGGRPRACPFGDKTTLALDRYIAARRKHYAADSTKLWLGAGGPLTPSGVSDAVDRIAREAGVGHLHAHLFRHYFSHRWLAAGGQETDLMRLNGWKSRSMVGRYAASAAAERAIGAHRKLSPADNL